MLQGEGEDRGEGEMEALEQEQMLIEYQSYNCYKERRELPDGQAGAVPT